VFDAVYVIHLPDAKRKQHIDAELAKAGLTATFVHATPPAPGFSMTNMRRNPRGEFGCGMSHIKAIAHAFAGGAQRPLFLEDDIRWRVDGLSRLRAAQAELPPDWDVLYLGGHPREACHMVSPHLAKVGRFSSAEAYSINRKAIPAFLCYWCDRIGQPGAMIDFILGEFAAMNQGFAVYPTVTEQVPGPSLIGEKDEDKRPMMDKGWKKNLCAPSSR